MQMTKEQKPFWFITGCSTGFGRKLTVLLIEQGVVRRLGH
jgi:NADP-dependent 3-hydroxy acid dehydrogenase YdfG